MRGHLACQVEELGLVATGAVKGKDQRRTGRGRVYTRDICIDRHDDLLPA